MICPNCHTENRANAKYCDECGYELPTVAHVAREMFEEGADTGRLNADATVDFKGFDLMNDSSFAPATSRGQVGYDAIDDLGGADTADVTQVFGAPAPSQVQRIYMAGVQQQSAITQVQQPVQGYYPPDQQGQPPQYAMGEQPSVAKRRATAVVIAVLCTIVAIAAIAGITYSMQFWGGKIVPDVVGMDAQDAKAVIEKEGLATEVVQVKSDDAEGIVLAINPDAGNRVQEGSTVTLDVSVPRTVPDIVGMELEKAETALSKEGFENVEVVEVKSNGAEGVVLSVNPVPGTRAKAESRIKVEASVPYRVPEVAGMNQEQATSLIESEGYHVDVKDVYAEDVEEGLAVGTDPKSGTALDSGSTVVLNLAKHRSSELVKLTSDYLKGLGKARINGLQYEVSEVKDVVFKGDDTCSYTLVARPYETHSWFGFETETRYGNPESIQGTIKWDAKGGISDMTPKIEKL